ncbi:hypothetical protein ACR9E3_02450 [Actinomycetospora sp. C-140]
MAREGRGGTGILILVMFAGIAIAVVSVGQVFQRGGTTWLGVVVGLAIAAVAGGVLVLRSSSRGR